MIDLILKDREIDMNEVVEILSLIMRKNLRFIFDNVDEDLNKLIYIRKGNCVGYLVMFNFVVNYLIK